MADQYRDFTTELMEDMDPELLHLVKNTINSFVKWDLIRFFHDNPNAADSVKNLAAYAGRDPSVVESEIEDLVQSGLLSKELVNDTPVYALSKDQDTRRLAEKFVNSCNERHFRIKVVYHIMRAMK